MNAFFLDPLNCLRYLKFITKIYDNAGIGYYAPGEFWEKRNSSARGNELVYAS